MQSIADFLGLGDTSTSSPILLAVAPSRVLAPVAVAWVVSSLTHVRKRAPAAVGQSSGSSGYSVVLHTDQHSYHHIAGPVNINQRVGGSRWHCAKRGVEPRREIRRLLLLHSVFVPLAVDRPGYILENCIEDHFGRPARESTLCPLLAHDSESLGTKFFQPLRFC